jgi:magnesium transporter
MLRVVNQIVDGYLDLRRELTKQLDHWQTELIDPRSRFTNWGALMQARSRCTTWTKSAKTSAPPCRTGSTRSRRCLARGRNRAARARAALIRSRDVLEHIERVVHHVHRLEQNAETAVQMHFSVRATAPTTSCARSRCSPPSSCR